MLKLLPDELQKLQLLKLAARSNRLSVCVSGVSMMPTIKPGTRVAVAMAEEYAVGDVVVFLDKATLYIHRIIDRIEDRGEIIIITKGDNSSAPDERIAQNQIIGVVNGNKWTSAFIAFLSKREALLWAKSGPHLRYAISYTRYVLVYLIWAIKWRDV